MSLIAAVAGSLGRGIRFALLGGTQIDLTINPTACNVSYQLTSTGLEQVTTTSSGTATLGNWVTPTSAAGANYECQATITSGTLSSGTSGSWLVLSSTRTWTVTRSTVGSKACTFTIDIRNASTLAVVATASVTISANVDP